MSKPDRKAALAAIEENITRSGYHLYLVSGGSIPRFAYTIGLTESLGAELILAGALIYSGEEVRRIVAMARQELLASGDFGATLSPEGLGRFTLRKAHDSWARMLMLGAFDYYREGNVQAYQLVPDSEHATSDVPDLSREWERETEPVWQWLRTPWPHSVPAKSTAATNVMALRGEPITEVVRWEDGAWEMFAGPGPEVTEAEARVVPLASLLAVDPSLRSALRLEIGQGIWRAGGDDEWHPWERSDATD